MNRRKGAVLILLILVAGFATYKWVGPKNGAPANEVRVSGNIEVTDAEASFKIPGRIKERLVDEGGVVEKGAPVALLEAADLEAEVAVRRAEWLAAQAHLAELEAGSRPSEIDAANARLASAQADRERLETEFHSAQQLLDTKVISQEEYVQRRKLFESAAARAEEAAAQLKLVREGPRTEQIEQAKARVAQAKAALDLAETRLGYAELRAPLSGVVLSKNVEPGEYVAPGTPVVTIGDLNQPWLRAYINETDLGRVKLGQRVRVTTDTYPGKQYQGVVSFIADQAEFTPKNVQTQKERVKLVYRIKVEIPNPHRELKPGMPADAAILVESDASGHGRD